MADYPKAPDVKNKFITAQIADVSTAGQIYVVPGFRCKIKKIWSALNGAIGTADAVLTAKIAGTAVTGGTITIATASSAAGDVDSCIPTAANTVGVGQAIEIETDGASSNTVAVTITIEVEPV